MIRLVPADRTAPALEAALALARLLSEAGHPARVDAALAPDDLSRGQKYDLAVLGTGAGEGVDAVEGISGDRIILLGAEHLSQPALDRLAGLTRPRADRQVTVIGRFTGPADRIAAQAKVAYVTGVEPRIVDLGQLLGPPLLPGVLTPALCPRPRHRMRAHPPTLLVHARAETLAAPAMAQALSVLGHQPGLRLLVLPESGGRDRLRGGPGESLPLADPMEFAAGGLAGIADAVAIFDLPSGDERLAALMACMIGRGRPVLDCTAVQALCASGAPVLRGPDDPAALWPYLERTVLPALEDIARFIAENPWTARHRIDRFLAAIGLEAAPANGTAGTAKAEGRQVLFLPTNGVGLGHAQRCGLIAGAMTQRDGLSFAAFPSCLPMLMDQGLDCLPLAAKSPDHADAYANDILTYRRLAQAMSPGGLLVFDGGFLFDSLIRLIAEKELRAIWIRRGLWQAGHLDDRRRAQRARESLFDRIIQPLEAFDELNEPVLYGGPVRAVGPVVQDARSSTADRVLVRRDLERRLGRPFRELVVTMLGAGHAADRTAQTLALCNLFERRPDCLHLVVTWPGSPTPPALFGWRNTRVVQTRRALGLMQAADLVVSASGYNSFHEILYHGVPAILIPQMAPFMDDQRRRALAAAGRDLAATVEPEALLRLEREVQAFLDDGKAAAIRARLAAHAFPQRGTAAAAALIEAERDMP